MKLRLLFLIKSFLSLCLLTCIGIFLHELSHHLFGVPSEVSFSRNYPLVSQINNKTAAIIGTLAGPAANLFLGYIGLIVYRVFTRNKILHNFGMLLGVSNCFITLSGAVINLIVDSTSKKMSNDLEQVSSILGINILVLPMIFSLLALIPFKAFWLDSKKIATNKASFVAITFIAWLAGGVFLIFLDSVFAIRFRII